MLYVICSKTICENYILIQTPVPYVTFRTSNNNLNSLQEYFLDGFNIEYLSYGQRTKYFERNICNGEKTIRITVSKNAFDY